MALGSLPESVYEDLSEGNFVISKTERRFSSIPVDQAHEQENGIGRNQYTEYFKNIFEDRIATIDQPIKTNVTFTS